MKNNINNWYIYKGVKGVLADVNDEKFAGLTPVDSCGLLGFYPLSDIEGRDITDEDCKLEYYDGFEPKPCSINEEIVCEMVVNQGNEQTLILEFVNKDLYEQDLYERELCTLTNEYYDWTSELTKVVSNACDNWCDGVADYDNTESEEELLAVVKAEAEEEWKEIIEQYKSFRLYGEEQTFENVWEIISRRIRNMS